CATGPRTGFDSW
nr:immunoglobulin heavy chain junction region [Macaca mulatta]